MAQIIEGKLIKGQGLVIILLENRFKGKNISTGCRKKTTSFVTDILWLTREMEKRRGNSE